MTVKVLFILSCVLLLVPNSSLAEDTSGTEQRHFYQIADTSESDELDIILLKSGGEEENRIDPDQLDTRTLIKLHGIFMVVAWMGTTTMGVLIAR